MLSKSGTFLGHECVTFEDSEGHKWHVSCDDLVGVPRIGDHVLLPNPPAEPERYVVVNVLHEFIEQDVPEGTTGMAPISGDYKWMYAQLSDVIVTVEPS